MGLSLWPRHGDEASLGEPCRWWLGAVGGASAFALAGVLAFAALIAGLAAASTLAIVFAFTGVFCRGCLIEAGEAQAGLGSGDLGNALGGLGCYGGSAGQAGESRCQKQCADLILCHDPLTSYWYWGLGGWVPR